MTDVWEDADLPGPGEEEPLVIGQISPGLLPLAYPMERLALLERNANIGNVAAVKGSLVTFGQRKPITARHREDGTEEVTAGNTTLLAARELGWSHLAVVWEDDDDITAIAWSLADNRTADLGTTDDAILAELLEQTQEYDPELMAATGYTDADLAALLGQESGQSREERQAEATATLAARFLVPPFSVLDARQGYWQDRRRAWIALGIRSEEGRPKNLLKMSDTVLASQQPSGSPNRSVPASDSGNDPQFYYKKRRAEQEVGRELTTEEFLRDFYEGPDAYIGGTSIFDPVLCELAYRWWCPERGNILDPFAGGSVRGVVAARLGLHYHGIDLRPEQVAANEEQLASIGGPGLARWEVGDARTALFPQDTDLLFTCPPYFDLEQYSDDPADLSNAGNYDAFLVDYRQIIDRACRALRMDRFACVVVGDIRDTQGIYRNFVADTIDSFIGAGLSYYNEAILVTPVGSLALRAARIFNGARKLAKGHQNVLVFCKGDPQRAADACAPVQVPDLAAMFGELVEDEELDAREREGAADAGGSAGDAAWSGDGSEGHDLGQPPAEAPSVTSPAHPVVDPDSHQVGTAVAHVVPGWARGLDVERLRVVADLFRRHDGDLPLGAFTGVKEATVAQWHSEGALTVVGENEPVAAWVVHRSSSSRSYRDFRGLAMGQIPAGAAHVVRMAAAPGYGALLTEPLRSAAVAEIWQEHPVERWAAEQAGLHWRATKIRASSELVGVWDHRGSANGASPYSPLSYNGLQLLDLEYDPAVILEEARAAGLEWADHYAVYNKGHTWSAIALRGFGGDPEFIIKPAEMSKKWKADNAEKLEWQCVDTPLLERFPSVQALLEFLPAQRVRLMRLAPGNGELTRHADITDPEAGTEPGQLLRLHFPLLTNPSVEFHSWLPDGSVQRAHMGAGTCWSLDTRKPHTAWNKGQTERIHLVIDAWSYPELLERIVGVGDIESKVVPEEQQPVVMPGAWSL